ncbi:MAG: MFS transporter, partial [Anaerolineae bacterium]|nr:MFS transporter [Anaerolineae bacterium]
PQFLEEARGFSRSSIGAFGSINALGTAAFSLWMGRLSSWRGFYASLALVLASFILLLLTGAWPVVAAAYFMLGAYNTTRPMAVSLIAGRVREHQRGVAYALVDMFAGLAAVVGMNLAGRLYGSDPDWPFIVGSAGIVLALALGAILLRRSPPRYRRAARAYSSIKSSGK